MVKNEPETFKVLSPQGLEQLLTSDRFLNKLADRLVTCINKNERAKSKIPLADKEAARRLGISVSTVRRLKKSGEIGSVQTPRGRQVRERDIVEYFS